ncbi:MAG: hypothetical protein Q9159_003571 [Coniocarpon cinnabarinum]
MQPHKLLILLSALAAGASAWTYTDPSQAPPNGKIDSHAITDGELTACQHLPHNMDLNPALPSDYGAIDPVFSSDSRNKCDKALDGKDMPHQPPVTTPKLVVKRAPPRATTTTQRKAKRDVAPTLTTHALPDRVKRDTTLWTDDPITGKARVKRDEQYWSTDPINEPAKRQALPTSSCSGC